VRRDAVGHRRQRHHRQCSGDDLDRRKHDLTRRVRALANAAHHRDRLAVGRRGGNAAVARLVHVEPTGLELVVGTNDFDDANGGAVERTAANDDGGEAAGALEKTATRVAARRREHAGALKPALTAIDVDVAKLTAVAETANGVDAVGQREHENEAARRRELLGLGLDGLTGGTLDKIGG
jgi:hypothetical protein